MHSTSVMGEFLPAAESFNPFTTAWISRGTPMDSRFFAIRCPKASEILAISFLELAGFAEETLVSSEYASPEERSKVAVIKKEKYFFHEKNS